MIRILTIILAIAIFVTSVPADALAYWQESALRPMAHKVVFGSAAGAAIPSAHPQAPKSSSQGEPDDGQQESPPPTRGIGSSLLAIVRGSLWALVATTGFFRRQYRAFNNNYTMNKVNNFFGAHAPFLYTTIFGTFTALCFIVPYWVEIQRFFMYTVKPYEPYVVFFSGIIGTIALLIYGGIGFYCARDKERVKRLLNAIKPDEEEDIDPEKSYGRSSNFGMPVADYLPQYPADHAMRLLQEEAGRPAALVFQLFSERLAGEDDRSEAIARVDRQDGVWFIRTEAIDATAERKYLPRDFLENRIETDMPRALVFEKDAFDQYTIDTLLKDYIPVYRPQDAAEIDEKDVSGIMKDYSQEFCVYTKLKPRYYKHQNLTAETFQTRIRPLFDFTPAEQADIDRKIRMAKLNADTVRFYVLFSEEPEAGKLTWEATALVTMSADLWTVDIIGNDRNYRQRYLPEDFLREEIAHWNPVAVILEDRYADKDVMRLAFRNHIPAFHPKKIEKLRALAERKTGVSSEDPNYTVYESSKLGLIDKVTLWAAAQYFSRKYFISIVYHTLIFLTAHTVYGMLWGAITDYGDKALDAMGKFNFIMSYLSPLSIILLYPPAAAYLSKKIKTRFDRRSINLIKDQVTGVVKDKWKAIVANKRVTMVLTSLMWLNLFFVVQRVLYLFLFPGVVLEGTYGAGLLIMITDPTVFLVALFVWWFSCTIFTPLIGQSWGEVVVGELHYSEAATKQGYTTAYPVISAFGNWVWLTILQICAFAIGDGFARIAVGGRVDEMLDAIAKAKEAKVPIDLTTMTFANTGSWATDSFMTVIIVLTGVTLATIIALPILAKDYNANLLINDYNPRIPEKGPEDDIRKSHLVYAYTSPSEDAADAKPSEKMWVDIVPTKDKELCDVEPWKLGRNKSWLPWIDKRLSVTLGYRDKVPKIKFAWWNWIPFTTKRVTFEDYPDADGVRGPKIVFRKRFGRIVYGRDFMIREFMSRSGGIDCHVLFYPPKWRAGQATDLELLLSRQRFGEEGQPVTGATGQADTAAPTEAVLFGQTAKGEPPADSAVEQVKDGSPAPNGMTIPNGHRAPVGDPIARDLTPPGMSSPATGISSGIVHGEPVVFRGDTKQMPVAEGVPLAEETVPEERTLAAIAAAA
ncbi:MAG: hypothetical protein HQ558_05595 [Candidatus Omnitrophica bacterium]|nr:hypothetical protein [Candidatus Omnitrophota bacterium]